jgi:DNA polymerase III epsilon subunit-like protein
MSDKFEETHHIFFWDTETSGLFTYDKPPAILDLAIVDSKTGDVEQWLVNPNGVPIAGQAESVHGISLAMVSDRDNFGKVAEKMIEYIKCKAKKATPVLCGFNSHRFDNFVLLAELQRYGIEFPSNWLFADLFPHLKARLTRNSGPILLQDDLAKAENRKLTTIFETLTGQPLSGAHRAATDAAALLEIWKVVRARHPEFQLPVINAGQARGPRWGALRVRDRHHVEEDVSPSNAASKKATSPVDAEPVERLYGIGPKTRAALEAKGVATIGDFRSLFTGKLASSAEALRDHIRGELDLPLSEEYIISIAKQLEGLSQPVAAKAISPIEPVAAKVTSGPPLRVDAPLDAEPVDRLHGIGPKTRAALEAKGVATIGDLRSLFAGKLASSTEALRDHIRGELRMPLSEEYIVSIAKQLEGLPPPVAAK